MLRRIFVSFCCAVVLLLSACNKKESNDITELSQSEIYFFYQENCPHCHDAAAYIKEKHPDLHIRSLNIKMPGNKRMFQAAARTYKDSFNAGTPLICFGKNHIMGWGANAPKQFELFVKNYE